MHPFIQFISLLFLLASYSCTSEEHYYIEKEFMTVVNNENCQVEFYYPKLKFKDDSLNVEKVNQLYKNIVDYDFYAHGCNEIANKRRLVEGDYKVTLKTVDRLSIEFLTLMFFDGGRGVDTIYSSLVVNPEKVSSEELAIFFLSPKDIFPNFDRKVLYPYVKKYNDRKKARINLLAYETGSNYWITWGVTKTHFLIYVGGEGEAFGEHKIEIPIAKVVNEN